MTNNSRPPWRNPLEESRSGRGAFQQISLERRSSPRPARAVRSDAPGLHGEDLRRRIDRNSALLDAARPHLEFAASALADLAAVAYLVDREGVVLWSTGPSPEISRESGALPGINWSEREAGTNAAASALAADEPVLAVGSPHGSPAWRRYTAMAVPVHAPDGNPAGVAVIASAQSTPGGERLAMAAYAAFAAERVLLGSEASAQRRDARKRRNEAGRFRRLLDAAPDATVLVDTDGTILYANARVESLLGYLPEELLGKSVDILVPEVVRRGHAEHREQFLRAPKAREMGAGLELHARRRDGTDVPVEISLSPLRMREGTLVSAALRDVTARKEIVRRLETQYSVSRSLAEAATLADVAARVLEAVARGTGWDAGELWLLEGERLRATYFWSSPALDCEEFERETRALLVEKGRSVAGRVWDAAAPVLIARIPDEKNFARSAAALRAGLFSAFGFPITLGSKVIGVLGFFSRKEIALDEETRRMLTSLGSHLGQFIERRRAEERLRESEAKLALLLGQMPVALWAVDSDLKVTHCAGKIFGSGTIPPAESHVGKSVEEIYRANPNPSAFQVHRDALRGEAGQYDHERQGQSFKCYVEPLRDQEDRIVGALSAAIDVTDLKRSQALLKESEARLRLMTEQAPVALWTTDAGLRLTSISGGVLDDLGLAPRDLLGLTVEEICRKLEIEDTPARAHTAALAGERVDFEPQLRGKVLAGRVEPLRESGGRTVGVVGVAFDVTDRKRVEAETRRLAAELERRVRERTAQLEEALREMNAFSYTIAHDLRAPLRAIASGASIVLEERERMSDEARAWTERIEQAAHRMDALVTGLLDYSRLGRQNLLLEPVEWDHVVEDVLKQMRNEIAEQGAEVVAEPPFPRVRGHALTLTLALGNLLSNAFKFVPDSRRPRVRIRAEQGRLLGHAGAPAYGLVRLWVEDNGIGIAPEHRERIFGVFERLHLEKAYPGTGIGLAIVRRVVERMGGRVGVESELGRGSRFFIDLPGI